MLLVGDDWAEDHHDVELMDAAGPGAGQGPAAGGGGRDGPAACDDRRAARRGGRGGEVRVGIETDRGLWVMALVAAGYAVFGINPLQVARYRERRCLRCQERRR